jgi:hypothetical protein
MKIVAKQAGGKVPLENQVEDQGAKDKRLKGKK